MTLREIDHLLLGGGGAAAAAAETLRLEGEAGSILMLSAEDVPPYYRPALSKQCLMGTGDAAQLDLYRPDFYVEKRIEMMLNTRAVALDSAARIVTTANGSRFRYRRLLIATGAQPRRLGLANEDLGGVHHLRRRADCDAVRGAITAGARRAVVVGASFLGMEIAMSLLDVGLEVTMLEAGDLVLRHLEAPEISGYFRAHAEARGVRVRMGDRPVALHGDGRIAEVETAAGLRLPCDLLMISVGVEPASDFLAGSGVELDRGLVLVDSRLRTSAADVFAAGDITSFDDPVFACRRHIEHWDNAMKQGRLAARNMAGRRLRYDDVSYFFCDVGDLSFNMLGMPEQADERVARGSLDARSYASFYLKDDVPRALFSIGRPPDETRHAEGLIRHRISMAAVKAELSDPAFTLDHIPTQTVLVLQGGGAMGAFECGVVKALEEEKIFPDIVAGVSIGAINGAIIAAHPREATAALEAFWADISVHMPFFACNDAGRYAAAAQILWFGVPNFFRPRWMPSPYMSIEPPTEWTSYYDVTPLRDLLGRYVDFTKLPRSPVRLLVGAVNVATAQLETFDSYVDALTVDHIIASGSLPPAFPATIIDGKAYWDGGILSNSPLDMVIDRCGPDGKRVFVVDLYAGQRPLPANMMEVMARRDEILYSERIRNDLDTRELIGDYRRLVEGTLANVDPVLREKIRQRPLYIELMGEGAPMNITRFVRPGVDNEPSSRDYDFSESAIRANLDQGYAMVKKALAAS
jgi:NTE family protein